MALEVRLYFCLVERWGSRLGALLALIGGAVGLGNFLRFPFQAAKYGGGAFLVPYLVALVVLALPMVWIEMVLGRPGEGQAHSITRLFGRWHSPVGRLIGSWGVYASLVVGSYYALLTAWTLGYTLQALLGLLSGLTPETAQKHWITFQGTAHYWALGVLLLLGLSMALPIQKGLEKISLYAMPMLFILGLGIAVGALFLGKVGACPTCDSRIGLRYLYTPRWEALLNPSVWLAAVGQVFFSVGIGFAMYPVYASYYASAAGIRKAGSQTVIANTLAEVGLGGLIVVPVTTAFLGLETVQTKAGFGLGFEVMPAALSQWGGRPLITAWYFLLFLAAFSSLIAMGIVVRSFLLDEMALSPVKASWLSTGLMGVVGVPVYMGGEKVLSLYDLWGGTVFLIAVAAGEWWLFGRGGKMAWELLNQAGNRPLGSFWRVVIRYLTPLMLGFILVGSFFTPVEGDWGRALRTFIEAGEWPWSENALPLALWACLQSGWAVAGGIVLLIVLAFLITLALRART